MCQKENMISQELSSVIASQGFISTHRPTMLLVNTLILNLYRLRPAANPRTPPLNSLILIVTSHTSFAGCFTNPTCPSTPLDISSPSQTLKLLHMQSQFSHAPQSALKSATVDPRPLHASLCIDMIFSLARSSDPHHIPINSSTHFQAGKGDNCTFEVASQNFFISLPHAIADLSPMPLMTLALARSYKSPIQMICLALLTKYYGISLTMSKPKTPIRPTLLRPTLLSAPLQAQHKALPPEGLIKHPRLSLHIPTLDLYKKCNQIIGPQEDFSPASFDLSETYSTSVTQMHCSPLLLQNNNSLEPELPNQLIEDTSQRYPASARRKKKGNQQPTRRSTRLQARQRTPLCKSAVKLKNKSAHAKIPFDIDDSLNTLDAKKAKEILHATGLQITDKIE